MQLGMSDSEIVVSTHSRPKAAGIPLPFEAEIDIVSTHSRPKAAGGWNLASPFGMVKFQHTAARRRLVASVPKPSVLLSFNTQPPEGGWIS